MSDAPTTPGLQVLGDHVLVSGPALYRLALLADEGLRARRRAGTKDPASAADLVRVLARSAGAIQRQAEEALRAPVVTWDERKSDDLMTTAEVAKALGIDRRQAARLAGRLGARKVSGAANAPLLFARDAVEAEQVRRADEIGRRPA